MNPQPKDRTFNNIIRHDTRAFRIRIGRNIYDLRAERKMPPERLFLSGSLF